MNTTLHTGLQQWCVCFDRRLARLADQLVVSENRTGFCAIASYLAFNALQPLNRCVDPPVAFKRAQPPSPLDLEVSHCWVEVGGYCIDFTSGQFTRHHTYNKVAAEHFIFEPKRNYQRRLRDWNVAKYPSKSLSLNGIRVLLKGWPADQLPYNESIIQRFIRHPTFKFHVKREYQLQQTTAGGPIDYQV